jgi:hypothetical protein
MSTSKVCMPIDMHLRKRKLGASFCVSRVKKLQKLSQNTHCVLDAQIKASYLDISSEEE